MVMLFSSLFMACSQFHPQIFSWGFILFQRLPENHRSILLNPGKTEVLPVLPPTALLFLRETMDIKFPFDYF